MRLGRRGATALGTVTLVLGVTLVVATGVAAAHQPVFISEGVPADRAPLLEDGRVSFAIYGTVGAPGGEASFRVRHAEGERFTLEVLVPDRAPENERSAFDDLTVVVTDPSGHTTELRGAGVLARFDEPFSKTSYLRVITADAPAVAGVSTVTVRSEVPTRFTVATGREERFDGKVSSYTPPTGPALQTWYETPPPPSGPAPTSTTTTRTDATTTSAPTGARGSTAASSPSAAGASSDLATVAGPAGSTPSAGIVVGAILVTVVLLGAGAAAVAARRRN